jgi:hypothetical protein
MRQHKSTRTCNDREVPAGAAATLSSTTLLRTGILYRTHALLIGRGAPR